MRWRSLACLAVAAAVLCLAGPAFGLGLPPPVGQLPDPSARSATSGLSSSPIQSGEPLPVQKPLIEHAPAKIGYGTRFTITLVGKASDIAKVVLVRVPGAGNLGQDLMFELPILSRTTHDVTVQAPASSESAPPGTYLLIAQAGSPTGLIPSDPVQVLLRTLADVGVQPPVGVVGPSPSPSVQPGTAPTQGVAVPPVGVASPRPTSSEQVRAGSGTRQERPATLKLPNSRPFFPVYPLMPIAVAVAFILTAVGLRRMS